MLPEISELMRCSATFLPADPPREGRLAFWLPADANEADAANTSDGPDRPRTPHTGGAPTRPASGSAGSVGSVERLDVVTADLRRVGR
ncbi:hypothetical protein ACQEVM_22420 [Streptomyces sp. CA-243310]|uniref:hypothetical protein n=1 Tax=Streptomyces sp. CA-243310 TaxID=3240056 RepID=UPI003D909732